MDIRWKRLLCQAALWLATEMILSSLGLDDLADYSEYHLAIKYEAVTELLSSPLGSII